MTINTKQFLRRLQTQSRSEMMDNEQRAKRWIYTKWANFDSRYCGAQSADVKWVIELESE